MQQYIKTSTLELLPKLFIGWPTGRLIKNKKLDAVDIAYQLIFQLANNPADFGLWPLMLYAAHNWQHMRDIANRREAQNTNMFRWSRQW